MVGHARERLLPLLRRTFSPVESGLGRAMGAALDGRRSPRRVRGVESRRQQLLLSREDQGDDRQPNQIALGVRIGRADRRGDEYDDVVIVRVVPESGEIRRVRRTCVRERHERAQHRNIQPDGQCAHSPHMLPGYLRWHRLSRSRATPPTWRQPCRGAGCADKTLIAAKPAAVHRISRSRCTSVQVNATGPATPKAAKSATLAPSTAPRLAGIMKLKNLTALPNAPIPSAAVTGISTPSRRTTRKISNVSVAEARKWQTIDTSSWRQRSAYVDRSAWSSPSSLTSATSGAIPSRAIKRPPPPITPPSCTTTKPPAQTISSASSPVIVSISGCERGSQTRPARRPTASRTAWDATTVVLSAMTDTTASRAGISGRSRKALIGSPPTDAVGVLTLTASPARRAAARWKSDRGGRVIVKRQPKVSKSTTSEAGNTRTVSTGQDRRRRASHIAPGPRSQIR